MPSVEKVAQTEVAFLKKFFSTAKRELAPSGLSVSGNMVLLRALGDGVSRLPRAGQEVARWLPPLWHIS